MKKVGIMCFAIIGFSFYLFHYAVHPIFVFSWLDDGVDFVLLQAILFAICFAIQAVLVRLFKLKKKEIAISICALFAFCIIGHFFMLPDRIDFWFVRKSVEKKKNDSIKSGEGRIIISYYYFTKYTNRMPFMPDSRGYAYGTPAEIEHEKTFYSGSWFVPISNDGWYIVFTENTYNPY